MDTLDVLTLPEARQAVLIDSDTTYTDQDARLAALLTAISRRFDTLCGPIVQRTITAEVQSGGASLIELNHSPISSVTSITEYAATAGTVLSLSSYTNQPSSGYALTPTWDGFYKGKIYRRSGNAGSAFPQGFNNIVVTYVAGRYATTAVVDTRFKQGVALTLKRLFSREQRPALAGLAGPQSMNDVQPFNFPAYLIPNAALELLVDDIIPSVA